MIDENEFERDLRRASQRRARRRTAVLMAIAAVCLIAVFVLFRLLFSSGPNDRPQAAAPTSQATESTAAPAAPTTVAPSTAAPSTSPDEETAVLTDAQAALTAWGSFAVDRDLHKLDGTFHPKGESYRALRDEKADPAGPPAYDFTLSDAKLVPTDDPKFRVIRGKVTVSRPGEKPQPFLWDIWMTPDPQTPGKWLLWTVTNTKG